MHDPTDPVSRLLFNVLGMVAVFEAELIRASMREAKGRLRGKPPKLSPRQKPTSSSYRASEHTVSDLEELFGVSRSAVYHAVRRARHGATATADAAAWA